MGVEADAVGDPAGREATQSEGEADALAQELRDVAEAIEAGGPVELPTPPPEPTPTITWKAWP